MNFLPINNERKQLQAQLKSAEEAERRAEIEKQSAEQRAKLAKQSADLRAKLAENAKQNEQNKATDQSNTSINIDHYKQDGK